MSNPACAEGNHRKIIDQCDSACFCTSNGQTYSNCEHRFVVNVMTSDETGGVWVAAMNKQGTQANAPNI